MYTFSRDVVILGVEKYYSNYTYRSKYVGVVDLKRLLE